MRRLGASSGTREEHGRKTALSKEKTTEAAEPVDLTTLTKKELKHLREQVETEQAFLELEDKRIAVQLREISLHQTEEKYRYTARGINAGVVHLTQAVTESVVDYLTEKIDAFVTVHADLPKKEKPPLLVIINSPGGSVFEGWRLFDELRAASLLGHKVTTRVRGIAASMAAVLVQAGDERVIGPESYMMIHEPSSFAFGKAFEVKEQAVLMDRFTEQIAQKFAERSGKKVKEMKALFERTDAWLSAAECVKHGFVDRIA